MIHVKHPVDKINKIQEEAVNGNPEEKRRYAELFFTIGNATYIYHSRAGEYDPCEGDYLEWLEGLPENIRNDMQRKGFEACKSILSFTRYVLEKNDIGQEAFVRNLVGESVYDEYLKVCLKES